MKLFREQAKGEFPYVVGVIICLVILDQLHYLWRQEVPTLVNWYWYSTSMNYPERYAIDTTRLIKVSLVCWLLWRFARLYDSIWVETMCFVLFLLEVKEIWDYWAFQNSFSSIPEIIGFFLILIVSLVYYRLKKLE